MRVRGLLAALAVGSVLVGGCADPQEANDTLPTAMSAVEAEPTLAPLGPVDFPVPDEAREKTAEGAKAALVYYLELLSRQAGRSGQPLRDLSSGCQLCDFFADRYDSDAAAGYQTSGGTITVDNLGDPRLSDQSAEFSFSASQTAVTVSTVNGEPVTGRGSESLTAIPGSALLTWSDSRFAWILTQLSFS